MPARVDGNWTVQEHGPLEQVDENVWTVVGQIQMPPGPLPRRMTVARLADGGLVIFSAIALREQELRQVEALGRPAFLVVPNPFHRADAPAWKDRFPGLRVVAPPGARVRVKEVVPVDDVNGNFGDPSVQFITVPGTMESEGALVIAGDNGSTVVINDLIGNVRDARGLMRLVLSLMGFAGSGPQVPRMFRARMVKDKEAVAAQFRRWAEIPDLKRILVSHGGIIDRDPAGVLRRLANRLS